MICPWQCTQDDLDDPAQHLCEFWTHDADCCTAMNCERAVEVDVLYVERDERTGAILLSRTQHCFEHAATIQEVTP
jgi:hypothetical protein